MQGFHRVYGKAVTMGIGGVNYCSSLKLSLSLYIYIYMYMYVHTSKGIPVQLLDSNHLRPKVHERPHRQTHVHQGCGLEDWVQYLAASTRMQWTDE